MGTITSMVTAAMRNHLEYPLHSSTFSTPSINTGLPGGGVWRNGTISYYVNGAGGEAFLPTPSDEFVMGAWINFKGVIGPVGLFTGWAWDPGPPIDLDDWRVCAGVGYYTDESEIRLYSDHVGPWVGSPTLTLRASESSNQFGGMLNQRWTWHHMGMYFKKNGEQFDCSFYIDGHQFLTYNSGANEIKTMPDGWNCWLRMHTSSGWFIHRHDSFYIMDVTGEGDQIPPALRGLMSHMDGAGSSAQWTPLAATNWSNVDDPDIPPDEDTTYVETPTVANMDLYTHEGLADIVDLPRGYTIHGEVLVESFFKNVDDGEVTEIAYEHVVDVAAAQSVDGTFSNTTLDEYDMRQSFFTQQPDASAWNLVDYNAAEFGMNSK